MDIGAILIGLAILVLAFTYVTSPFGNQIKRNAQREKPSLKKAGSEDLKQQEELALKKLRDLDFDYQTGKVTEEDYHALRDKLVGEAAQLIDSVQKEEAQLEEQIAARRDAKARIEKCPACGGDLKPGDSFCTTCGKPVTVSCPKCGKTIRSTDLFCSSCGSAVKRPSGTVLVDHG